MKNNDFFDFSAFSDENSNEPIENVQLDLGQIQDNVSKYSNEKLCDMIVCDRYFGLEEKISPICMEELANRRLAGDTFNFEHYIEQAYKELPVIDMSMPDLRAVLGQAMSGKFGK